MMYTECTMTVKPFVHRLACTALRPLFIMRTW